MARVVPSLSPLHSPVGRTLVEAVRDLYEAHPYPHYPLLARPRWQDGYLAHAGFAQSLADAPAPAGPEGTSGATARARGTTVLLGGGEILPYVVRRWEPWRRRVISVDLSARSSRRARMRLLLSAAPTGFHRGDLDDYLRAAPAASADHVDVFGVLHHLPNPGKTLALISRILAPGGTVRMMVYNSGGRRWVTDLQRCFALLGLDALNPADLRFGRTLLALAAAEAPALAARLAQLGPATLANDARFADTFLHPREARLSCSRWLELISAAGLATVGLLDRYAELDDLPNPLWSVPDAGALEARALDGRFEGNLELFLTAPAPKVTGTPTGGWWAPLLLRAPPRLWFQFTETRDLTWPVRLQLWHAHLAYVLSGKRRPLDRLLARLPTRATQRLVRVGAILPGQIEDAGRRSALASPMAGHMEPPVLPAAVRFEGTKAASLLAAELVRRGRGEARRTTAALWRLHRAQLPVKSS